jgi:hypothetical protein
MHNKIVANLLIAVIFVFSLGAVANDHSSSSEEGGAINTAEEIKGYIKHH